MVPQPSRRILRWIAPAGIVVLAYCASFSLLPHDGFWINDNGCKFIQMEGLMRTHYRDFSIPWPGRDLDPNFRYNPLPPPFGVTADGRLYGVFQAVFPAVSSLPYRLFGFAGLYILPLLGGLLTLPAVWALAGFLPGRRTAQPLSLLLVGLCTPMWFYSMTFWEHTVTVPLAVWSVLFLVRYIRGGRGTDLVLSAVLCGTAVYFRGEFYMWGAVLAAVSALRGPRGWRDFPLFVALFALTLAPLWLFQWLTVGRPFGFHVTLISPFEGGVGGYISERWPVIRNLLLDSNDRRGLSLFAGLPFLLLFLICPRVPERALGKVALLLCTIGLAGGMIVLMGHLEAESPIWHLLESHGFFAVSPILILAFVRPTGPARSSPAEDCRRERENVQRLLWLISLLYVSVSVMVSPRIYTIGIEWGGRYLLPLYPLFGVMAASTLARCLESKGRVRGAVALFAGLLIALSLAFQLYSLRILYTRKAFSADFNRVIGRRPEKTIVAMGWFIPQELALNFYGRKIFLVGNPGDMEGLLGKLRLAGEREVLLLAWRRGGAEVFPGEKEVLDDGLNFVSLELKSVSLAER